MRISSPPTAWPCYYGIDTPTRGELIAATSTVEEIRSYLGADTLGYLSLEGLVDAVRTREIASHAGGPRGGAPKDISKESYCHACFSGDYPIPVPKNRPGSLPPARRLSVVD